MFRLEKLQISGFKSFYDPAELLFPARMAAVVGPNGCGKSNICDAIIWVLGEHRASHIRGETMEDVIFQGSERRRPLGMGEVTLTLSTENGHPAAEDNKVVIHRRVYRNGESEFRLNGKRVRFKDISDVLMDTGLGIRNYSVMEQGKIDLILSNKPQDRRKLIEEAAGITKYKTKRRAAELKLDETQANLLRIDDTLAEVTRNLNSLKRQAAKARKHKEVIDALSLAKRSLYAGRIAIAKKDLGLSESILAEAQGLESEATAVLAREEASLAETRTHYSDMAAQASSIREEMARLSSETERLRSFLSQSENHLSDLLQRAENARQQISSIETEAAEQQTLLAEKTAALESATAERTGLRTAADELERARQQRSDEVRTHEKNLGAHRETLMRTIGRISASRNQVHQIEIAVEKCEFYLGKLIDTARRVSENREDAFQKVTEWQQHVTDAEAALQQATDRAREALQIRDELNGRREAMRDTLKSTRDSISQTTYKIDSVRSLLTSLESQDEEVRSVILELIPNVSSAAESVRAAEGLELALDAILRDITKAVVVEDSSRAVDAIERLHERGAGRGAFISLDYKPSGEASAAGQVAQAIIGEGAVADAVRAAVPEAYIVEDLAEALLESRRIPHATFVTKKGDIVRGPLMYGGTREANKGIFSVKRQLHDLEQLLSSEEQKATGIAAELVQAEEELRAADDTRIIAEERGRQADQDLREKKNQRERASNELERYDKDLALASEEQSLYEDEKARLFTRKNDAINELTQLETSEREGQQNIQSTEEALKTAREEFEAITEVASRARVDLESAIGVVNAVQREHENLSRIVYSLTTRGAQLKAEIESLEAKRSDTAAAADASRAQLEQTLASATALSEKRIQLEAEVADLHLALQTLETQAMASRESWNQKREALFDNERRLDRARSAFDLLREQVHLDLHCGIETIEEVAPPVDDEARDILESEVLRLTDQIEK
ncbi:MAG TPA: AAA family ATPase, partial [Thermoanaerobaculia bacterium]|nr:AAA family ATPase [Thermoanaerobaculia bacterium]